LDTKRKEVTYEQALEHAFFIEDLHKNLNSKDGKIHSNLMQLREGTIGNLKDKFYFIWHVILRPKKFFVLAALAIILSVELVLGELIILFQL